MHHFYVIYSWPCYWYLASERNSNQIRTMGWRAPHPSAIHPSAPGQPLQTGHAVMVRKKSCSLNKALSRKWVNKLRKTIFLRTRALCPLSFPAAHPLPSPIPCLPCMTAYAMAESQSLSMTSCQFPTAFIKNKYLWALWLAVKTGHKIYIKINRQVTWSNMYHVPQIWAYCTIVYMQN